MYNTIYNQLSAFLQVVNGHNCSDLDTHGYNILRNPQFEDFNITDTIWPMGSQHHPLQKNRPSVVLGSKLLW